MNALAEKPPVAAEEPSRLGPIAATPDRRDQEFLLAALAILETPPSPVRLALIGIIATLVVVALAWSWFGRIDIVAIGQGKVQPTGRVRVVQPLETGKVSGLLVRNGARVAAGDVLVELAKDETAAEETALQVELSAALGEIARRRTTLAAVREGRRGEALPPIAFDGAVPEPVRSRESAVLAGDLATLDAGLSSFAAQRRQRVADRERLAGTVTAQAALVETLRERVDMRAGLVERHAGARARVIDALESLQEQEATLAGHKGQLGVAETTIEVLEREMARTRETFLGDNMQKLADAERRADETAQRLAKAKVRTARMTLRSPIAGTIQALSVTTVGQVVTTGQQLMRIVPEGEGLEVEAYLLNKDIGLIRPGQEAVVKVEAFPFTRFGTVAGTVARIAADAIPEPDAVGLEGDPARSARATGFAGAERVQNLVFPVTVALVSAAISADGAAVPLSPGMAVTVEVKTGRRRILEYLFSPMVEVGSRALKER